MDKCLIALEGKQFFVAKEGMHDFQMRLKNEPAVEGRYISAKGRFIECSLVDKEDSSTAYLVRDKIVGVSSYTE